MSAARTLLFCVGATKASTGWLFQYLSHHPECHLRSIKELHFFDSLDRGRAAARIARLQVELSLLPTSRAPARSSQLQSRRQDIEGLMAVLQSGSSADYMAYLNGHDETRHLVADITPSYALLSVDRLKMMAGLLPDVRFLYLLRDPVARLWSHVRMAARRQDGDFAGQALQVFEAVMAGREPAVTERGDYRSTLARLDAAVDPSRLLVMFQEVLLTHPGLQRVCAFLGIAHHPGNFSNRVHAGFDLAMTPDQLQRARVALRPQYEFAASRLGTLPEAWLRNMGEGVA